MIGRRALVTLAIAAGLASGALYLVSVQRVPVVVAARDVPVPRALVVADLATRDVPPDAVPDGALHAVDDAVGLVPSGPLLGGQLVLRRGLAPAGPRFASGIELPAGMRAFAIPVSAVGAVGGAVRAGASVDIVAVPVPGRAPADRTTEMLVTPLLVLDVRSDTGAAFDGERRAEAAIGAERLGSVVVAVPSADALWLADRIATSTFVLALRAP